ncbi:MAG TPA: hypothetical protein VMW01_09085 [Williamwhitmania sp.]|nr:hypothetical protein [Williamwhitmania sp.]
MIFSDKITERKRILEPEFMRLMELALKRQKHIGDLLLVEENGFFSEDALKFTNSEGGKYSPYAVGPGKEGHSEQTHYTFIDNYRKNNIHKYPYTVYLKGLKYLSEDKSKYDELIESEETSIQIEMLIYLKFWEADMIIKKLYQFVRILNGESYDWYFKIAEGNKKNKNILSRHEIIRVKIRDRLESISPILHDLINKTYKTQIRNSIAHSNYSFAGRVIMLNNYIQDDPYSNISSITFNDWIDVFHNTLMLHNQYIWLNNAIKNFYITFAMKCDNCVPIMITDKDGNKEEAKLISNSNGNNWVFMK